MHGHFKPSEILYSVWRSDRSIDLLNNSCCFVLRAPVRITTFPPFLCRWSETIHVPLIPHCNLYSIEFISDSLSCTSPSRFPGSIRVTPIKTTTQTPGQPVIAPRWSVPTNNKCRVFITARRGGNTQGTRLAAPQHTFREKCWLVTVTHQLQYPIRKKLVDGQLLTLHENMKGAPVVNAERA